MQTSAAPESVSVERVAANHGAWGAVSVMDGRETVEVRLYSAEIPSAVMRGQGNTGY